MKLIKYFFLFCVASTLCILGSCMNDDPNFGQDEESKDVVEGEGQISFAEVKLSVNVNVTTKGNAPVETGDYIVQIYSTKNNLLVKEYPKFSEMPEIITLEVGDYRIEVLSHKIQLAEWEKPFYKGTQEFSIRKDEVTVIKPIECTLQNIMVTLAFSDDLKSLLRGDESVTVTVGKGELNFNGEAISSGRAGFFQAAEVSNIIVAKFQGTVDGEWTQITKSFINVKGGEHRNITFNLDIPSVGDMALGLRLNAYCTRIDLTSWIDPGKETILPEDPSVNPGPGNAPTIVGEGFNIMDEIEVEKDETKTIIVNITADNGIQNLKVKIDSETLTSAILNDVGLSSEFDLANPGSAKLEEGLRGLGFPVKDEVVGKKAIVFDITNFTPLLGIYGLASHNFIITVVDQAGNTKTATLALKSVEKKTR